MIWNLKFLFIIERQLKPMSRYINLILIAFLLLFTTSLYGQTDAKIVNQGPVPNEFISPVKGRFEAAKSSIEKTEKSAIKKAKSNFYLQSNFQLDYILKSGKVVFNEEIYNYLNKVLAILIKAQPALEGKIKLYPIKLDNANAFTFNEGYIFVNIGLLARLNNEAELAFILGHEINHYTNEHSIKKQLKKLQIKEEDPRFKLSRYSRIHEFEADKEGYELFAKTPYDKNAAVTALEMLYLSNQPYAERKFNFDFFELGSLYVPQIDSVHKAKESAKQFDLELSEEEADSLATHPALEDRIREIKSLVEKSKDKGEVFIAHSEETFKKIQMICRLEMARIHLIEKDYQKAFYLLFLLKKDYPNQQEVQFLNAILWGKFCLDLQHKSFKDLLPTPVIKNNSFINGYIEEEEQLRKIITGLNKEEIHLIALKHIYVASMNAKTNVELDILKNHIIKGYRANYGRSTSDFAQFESFSKDAINKLYAKEETTDETSKSARIRKAKAKKKKFDFERSFAKYALSDLIANDSEFKKLYDSFKAGKKEIGEEEEEEDDASEDKINQSKVAEKNKKNKVKLKAPDNLGTNKVILLEPQYVKRDNRKSEPIDLIGNESIELELINTIRFAGEKAGMTVQVITPNEIESNEIQKFNDFAILKSWITESLNNKDHYNPSVHGNEIKEIIKRYDSRYVTIFFSRSLISRKKSSYFLKSLLGLYIHPLVVGGLIVRGFFPDRSMDMLIGIFDMEENKLIYAQEYNYTMTASDDLVKSQLYYIFKNMTK